MSGFRTCDAVKPAPRSEEAGKGWVFAWERPFQFRDRSDRKWDESRLIFINAELELNQIGVVLASPDQLMTLAIDQHFGWKWTRVVV